MRVVIETVMFWHEALKEGFICLMELPSSATPNGRRQDCAAQF
jgi:hypothetical protein